MRVLVIDDEPDVLLLCRVNLEVAGHEVLEAGDGDEGLRIAFDEHPDLILLDVMLPTRDGIEILGELSGAKRTRDVPVVLLTAKAQVEDQVRGWSAGASEYVTKPFAPDSLAETVTRVREMTPEERDDYRDEALRKLTHRP
ncbi:MAG TPA: response regulator [Actinomycetota bacterium]|nr:response regulator [Actinomycetota bacterium]